MRCALGEDAAHLLCHSPETLRDEVHTDVAEGGAAWRLRCHSDGRHLSEDCTVGLLSAFDLICFVVLFSFFLRHWDLREQSRLRRQTLHSGWGSCTFTFSVNSAELFWKRDEWRSPDVNNPLRSVTVRFVILVCFCPAQRQADSEASFLSLVRHFIFFSLHHTVVSTGTSVTGYK